ncbi:MAG: hypothetical protein KBD16_00285 [Candidatus Pacebacteria bacterium]|nr:hypothetical protein [Candidatus Paceibacterota bacterium]
MRIGVQRVAQLIVSAARKSVLERKDDKEAIEHWEARLLQRAGATNIRTMRQVGGSYRTDMTFRGVDFVTVTKTRLRRLNARNLDARPRPQSSR